MEKRGAKASPSAPQKRSMFKEISPVPLRRDRAWSHR